MGRNRKQEQGRIRRLEAVLWFMWEWERRFPHKPLYLRQIAAALDFKRGSLENWLRQLRNSRYIVSAGRGSKHHGRYKLADAMLPIGMEQLARVMSSVPLETRLARAQAALMKRRKRCLPSSRP